MPREGDLASWFYIRVDMDFNILSLEVNLLTLLLPGGRCCGESMERCERIFAFYFLYFVAFDLFNMNHTLFFITDLLGDRVNILSSISLFMKNHTNLWLLFYIACILKPSFFNHKTFPVSNYRVHFQELYEIPPS